jgi:glycosyltransferase involved in cell wall biosynthesis
MSFTLVLPAFNEAARIGATLRDYAPAVQARGGTLLVVVNGSVDDTERVVREGFMPDFPCIRLVVIPEQVGKGGALMRGFREAEGDWIGYTDADGSTSADSFFRLAEHLTGNTGIVIGSRWLRDSDVPVAQPLSRRVVSRLFNLLVRALFGMNLRDTQCGAKLLRPEALREVLPRIGSTQWAFDVELIFQVRRAGYGVRERPVTWRDREGSKVRVWRSAWEMSLALTRLRMLHSPLRGIVHVWDRTLGRRLFDRRMRRMRTIYAGTRRPR